MKKLLISLLAATAFSLSLVSGAAFAVSPSEQECEAAGGTFERNQGTVSCVIVTEENVGNSPNSQTTTTETDNTGQGNSENKEETESSCAGPGGSTSSAHCQ